MTFCISNRSFYDENRIDEFSREYGYSAEQVKNILLECDKVLEVLFNSGIVVVKFDNVIIIDIKNYYYRWCKYVVTTLLSWNAYIKIKIIYWYIKKGNVGDLDVIKNFAIIYNTFKKVDRFELTTIQKKKINKRNIKFAKVCGKILDVPAFI